MCELGAPTPPPAAAAAAQGPGALWGVQGAAWSKHPVHNDFLCSRSAGISSPKAAGGTQGSCASSKLLQIPGITHYQRFRFQAITATPKLTGGSISELSEQHNAVTATARAPSSKITAEELTTPWARSQLQGMLWLHTQEQIWAAALKEKGICSHYL